MPHDEERATARHHMTRRVFVNSGLLGGALAVAEPFLPHLEFAQRTAEKSAFAPFELEEATLRSLQDGMQSGKYTARKIVEAYLSRINALNHRGPVLNQVLEINPEAFAAADALDAERKAKGPEGRFTASRSCSKTILALQIK